MAKLAVTLQEREKELSSNVEATVLQCKTFGDKQSHFDAKALELSTELQRLQTDLDNAGAREFSLNEKLQKQDVLEKEQLQLITSLSSQISNFQKENDDLNIKVQRPLVFTLFKPSILFTAILQLGLKAFNQYNRLLNSYVIY